MGCICTKENSREAWFISPFRNENQASLKVDKSKNVWFDHGSGKGGTLIDFVKMIRNYNVKEALAFLRNLNQSKVLFSFHQQNNFEIAQTTKCRIIKVGSLQNPALIQYLSYRKISIVEAKKYCEEIHFSFNVAKTYFGIGFRNNSNGFELRNKYFKGCLLNKNITWINNDCKAVCVFESFFDFLSYRTLKWYSLREDYIILNSTAIVNKCLPFLQNFLEVKTYLDRDISGKNATGIIERSCKTYFKDCSNLYENYKDLNDYLTQTNKLSSSGKCMPKK